MPFGRSNTMPVFIRIIGRSFFQSREGSTTTTFSLILWMRTDEHTTNTFDARAVVIYSVGEVILSMR